MRIGIDARKLHDFGIGTYVRNLLKQLARLDTGHEYVVLCRRADVEHVGRLGGHFRAVPEGARPYSIGEQFSIPLALRRARVDLFHEPHYVLPPLARVRSVVTIHDCIHLRFPQYLPGRLAYAYARTFLRSAARRANRILTVSEASKADILSLLKAPAERVIVIPNAIDDRFGTPPSSEELSRVRERYRLDDPFVLYAGNIRPHKNLVRLIEAFHLLRTESQMDRLKLLILGDEISKYPALRHAVHRLKLHQHVRFLGFVSDERLAALYRLANVFVFPSLCEGFGLPPLEAMASGTPVVTSNVSSLPEVVGDAAVLVDPYDPASIAEGMHRVLVDADLRADLSARGLRRARQFSWERSVRRVLEIYDDVLQGDARS